MVTADAMAVGVSRALGIPASRVCFAEERMPAPRLSDHKVVCACYVDNGNIVGSDKAVVNKALSGFLEELDHRKLVAHEIVHASPRFECGGALFDFDIAWCSPKPRRVWRLYKSIGELLRIGGATGDAVRVIAGHIVHLFMLLRPALASLHLIYCFINQFGLEFASFFAAPFVVSSGRFEVSFCWWVWTWRFLGARSHSARTHAHLGTQCPRHACRLLLSARSPLCGRSGDSSTSPIRC